LICERTRVVRPSKRRCAACSGIAEACRAAHRRSSVSGVRPGGTILEVAPGPGYLAIELARRGYAVTALDISASFVKIARDTRCGRVLAS
jgi:2-polyprenyl-3-methyl-5-hydroxy-6-metoxy-1,4-benzoquinol methylase